MPEEFDPYYKWLAIPPENQPPDHYQLLGLRRFEDNRDVISNAADQRMAHVRTFQGGAHTKTSQRVLNELAAARLCLLAKAKKAAYDATLSDDTPDTPAPPAASIAGVNSVDEPVEVPSVPAQPIPSVATVKPGMRRGRRAPLIMGAGIVVCVGALIAAILHFSNTSSNPGVDSGVAKEDKGKKGKGTNTNSKNSKAGPSKGKGSTTKTKGKSGSTTKGGTSKGSGTGGSSNGSLSVGATKKLLRLIPRNSPQLRGRVMWLGDRVKLLPNKSLQLRLATALPPAYRLTMVVTRDEGTDGIGLGLRASQHQFAVVVDMVPQEGYRSGFQLIDGQRLSRRRSNYHTGQLLARGKKSTITVEVFADTIRGTCNGREFCRWKKAEFSRLGSIQTLPPPSILTFAGGFTIHDVALTALSERASAPPPAHLTQNTTNTDTTGSSTGSNSSNTNSGSSSTNNTAGKRATLPSANELAAAKTDLSAAYEAQIKGATVAELKEVAAKLLEKASDDETVKSHQVMLARFAAQAYLRANLTDLAQGAASKISDRFDAKAEDQLVEALRELAAEVKYKQHRVNVLRSSMALIEKLKARADLGLICAEAAYKLSQSTNDVELRKKARSAREEQRKRKASWELAQKAQETLKTKASDPEANLVYGRYLCLEGDWANGIKHLQNSNIQDVTKAAAADVAKPFTGSGQYEAGNAWWNASKDLTDDNRKVCMLRAYYWYHHSYASIAAADRRTIETRMSQIRKQLGPIVDSLGEKRYVYGLVGRIRLDNRLVPGYFGYSMAPRSTTTYLSSSRLSSELSRRNVKGQQIQILASGSFELKKATSLRIYHRGGSSNGGAQLLINNQVVSTVGGNSSRSSTTNIDLAAGKHEVVWKIAGSDIGSCNIQLSDSQSFDGLSVIAEKPFDMTRENSIVFGELPAAFQENE